MAMINSINRALFALGILFVIANFALPHSGYNWFIDAGIFFILLSAILSLYLIRDQRAQIVAHKEQIALHETRIAAQDVQISGHKAEMADKDAQIAGHKAEMADMKVSQSKPVQDVPPLAETVSLPVDPAIAPVNESVVEQITETTENK